MPSDSNKRDFTRVPSGLDVDIRFDDGTELTEHIDDVSVRGLFVQSETRFPVGTKCRLVLHLGGRGHGIALEASGQVARCTEEGMGMRFDEISYDAFEHLRNLVRFNSGDPEAIEDELDDHLGIRKAQ